MQKADRAVVVRQGAQHRIFQTFFTSLVLDSRAHASTRTPDGFKQRQTRQTGRMSSPRREAARAPRMGEGRAEKGRES
ncbi:hypothetical protein VTH06DRAFT_3723 [Thermothelomyces fergusii]